MTMAHMAVSQDLQNHLVVTGASGWFAHYDIEIGDNFFSDPFNEEKFNLVGRIISLQVSYYLLRMMSYLGEGQSEIMYEILNEHKEQYKARFGEEFPDPNGELIHGHL